MRRMPDQIAVHTILVASIQPTGVVLDPDPKTDLPYVVALMASIPELKKTPFRIEWDDPNMIGYVIEISSGKVLYELIGQVVG